MNVLKYATLVMAATVCIGQAQAADFNLHADKAELLIRNVPANQNYYTSSTTVRWRNPDQLTSASNDYYSYATCAPWITQTLINSYPDIGASGFRQRFTGPGVAMTSSPTSAAYASLIESGSGFTKITKVADIKRGDIGAIPYKSCAGETPSVTGHTWMFAGAPMLLKASSAVVPGTSEYAVGIMDSTSYPHGGAVVVDGNGQSVTYSEIRNSSWGNGAGLGYARLFVDSAGTVVGYTWSTTGGPYYAVGGCRSLSIGRLK